MGILDLLSGGDDPAQRQGMTALAMGLLSGGNFNEALARGVGMRQEAINGAQDRGMKKKLTDMQIAQMEQAQRAADMQMGYQKQAGDFWSSLNSGGATAPAVQGQFGSGTAGILPTPNGEDIVRQPGNGNDAIKNLTAQQVEMLERGGIKVADTWKFLNTQQSAAPGSMVTFPGGGKPTYVPNLDKGMVPSADGRTAMNMPGYLEASGAQTSATETAKTNASLIDVNVGGGQTRKMTFSDYQKYAATGQLPGATSQPAAPSGGRYDGVFTPDKPVISDVTGAFAPDSAERVWNTIQKMPNGPEKTGMTAAYVKQFGGAQNPSAGGSPKVFGATQSTLEKTQDEAMGRDFAEMGKSIINTGMVARSNLSAIDRMESLLNKVGPTGNVTPYIKEFQSLAASFNVKLSDKTQFAEAAQQLALGMAGKLKQPGSGTTSDKDFDNFVAQIPSISKTPGGNALIIETLRGYAKRDKEIADLFKSQFGGKYSNDAQKAIDAYIDANPVFKAQTEDRFKGFSIIKR